MARELLGLPLDGRGWQTQFTYPNPWKAQTSGGSRHPNQPAAFESRVPSPYQSQPSPQQAQGSADENTLVSWYYSPSLQRQGDIDVRHPETLQAHNISASDAL